MILNPHLLPGPAASWLEGFEAVTNVAVDVKEQPLQESTSAVGMDGEIVTRKGAEEQKK